MNLDLSTLVALGPAAEPSAPVLPAAAPGDAFGQLLAGIAAHADASSAIAPLPILSAAAPAVSLSLAAPALPVWSARSEIGDPPLELHLPAPASDLIPSKEAVLPLVEAPATRIALAVSAERAEEDHDDAEAPSSEQEETSLLALPLPAASPLTLPAVAALDRPAPVLQDRPSPPDASALADSQAGAVAAPLTAELQPDRVRESPNPLTAANDGVPPATARPPVMTEPRGRIAPATERRTPDAPLAVVVKPAAEAAIEPANLGRPVLSPAAQIAAQSQTPAGQPGDGPRNDVPAEAVLPMAPLRVAPASDTPPLFVETKVALDDPVAFAHDIATTITRGVKQGRRSIDIRLDPAELGRIEIRLTTGAKGQVQAVIAAENPVTYDLLRRDGGNLLRSLQDAGLKADSSSLAFDLRSGTGSDTGRRPYQQHQRHAEPEPLGDGAVAVAAAPRSSARGRLI